jgi:hypothetical protein
MFCICVHLLAQQILCTCTEVSGVKVPDEGQETLQSYGLAGRVTFDHVLGNVNLCAMVQLQHGVSVPRPYVLYTEGSCILGSLIL